MPFPTNGTLTTDTRETAISETWDTQTDWNAYQSKSSVSIDNGVLKLSEIQFPTSGLKHAYLFNDTSNSGIAVDSEGNDNADILGASYSTDSIEGTNSLSFDGNGDYVQTNHTLPISGFTVSIFFKTSTPSSPFLSTWIPGSQRGFVCGIGDTQSFSTTDGVVYADWRFDNDNRQKVRTTDSTFADGNYHNCTITWDNSLSDPQDKANIYIDGNDEPLSTKENQGGGSSWSQNNLEIGTNRRETSSFEAYYTGVLDYYLEYDRVLTDSGITDIASIL